MTNINDLNILTNGDFSNGLTGWNVENPSGNDAPGVSGNSGVVSFNSGNETLFGDSIDQGFVTTIGNTYAVTLDLIENNSGNARHTFRIDILDDTGAVIETVTQTVGDNSTRLVAFTFVATTAAANIRITNTTSSSSIGSDGKVDNVRVIDVTGDDDLDGTGAGEGIRGGPGNDTITGDDGNDALLGDDGNDAIYAGDGDDIVVGNDGNDELRGGNGDDTLFGGEGDDLIYAGNDEDIVVAGSGNDDIRASFGNDVFYGGDGDDRFVGSQLNATDTIFGGDGKDTFQIISGARWTINNNTATAGGQTTTLDSIELVIGSRQADTLSTANSDIVEIFGGGGNDRVNGSEKDETLSGDAGNDTINGEGGNDTLFGGDGNDQIFGGDGDDSIEGGDGSDLIVSGDGDDTVFGGDGFDLIELRSGNDVVYGGDGADDVDTLGTQNGNKLLFGGVGGDALYGGDGDDGIFGGVGSDILEGNDGNDTVFGGDNDDFLGGGGGNDQLIGDAGSDEVFADAGDDTLDGGAGADSLFGGSGNDIFSMADDGSRNVVDGGAEVLYGGEDNTLDVSNFTSGVIFEFNGISNPNLLISDNGTEIEFSQVGFLIGTDFDDDIESVFFFDIDAGDGNDIVRVPGGRSSPQRFDGGDGTDTLDLSEGNTFVDVNLATGALNFTDGAFNFENVIGTGSADTLIGSADANAITGGGGNDGVFGGQGNDLVAGEAGTDLIKGGDGADELFGGEGNDNLEGGAGADVLDGGAGIDLAEYFNAVEAIFVNMANTAQNRGVDAAGDTFIAIENVAGGRFRDIILGDNGGNSLFGRDGNDLLFGGGGDDRVVGGNGFDLIKGGTGNDTLSGGEDSDNLEGNLGADTLDGGAGIDTAEYFNAIEAVVVNLGDSSQNQGADAVGDVYIDIEFAAGGRFDDTIIGDDNANRLFGRLGNDTLDGGGGIDFLDGSNGDDRLIFRGSDAGIGGNGADTFEFVNDGPAFQVVGIFKADEGDLLDISNLGFATKQDFLDTAVDIIGLHTRFEVAAGYNIQLNNTDINTITEDQLILI